MVERKTITIISIVASTTIIALILTLGVLGPIPLTNIRPLGLFYALFMANRDVVLKDLYPFVAQPINFWAASTEAITAILWDYRGLDTLFETSVFFFAIIGSLAVFRFSKGVETKEVEQNIQYQKQSLGLSLIVKTITKIIFVVITVVSAAIALHGQLTPGGGFQGGATFAVAPLLAITALSRFYVEEIGLKKNTMLLIRTMGLLIIALLAIIPLVLGLGKWTAYIMENQPKTWAEYPGFPSQGLGVLLGSLVYYNVAELLAVGAGFTVIFLLLALPEDFFKKILSVEAEEHG